MYLDGLNRRVALTEEDYLKCTAFSLGMWYSEKAKGDWRRAKQRDIGDYINDHGGGKLAEIAFCRFLENFGLKGEPNFEIYPGPREVDRGGDIWRLFKAAEEVQPRIAVDVKKTKPNSRYFLVDEREFQNRRYDAYVSVLVSMPLDHLAAFIAPRLKDHLDRLKVVGESAVETAQKIQDMAADTLSRLEAEMAGFVWRTDLEEEGVIYTAEEGLPHPDHPERKLTDLTVDNRGFPIIQLRNWRSDWESLGEGLIEGRQ